jgi:hypothetical protein
LRRDIQNGLINRVNSNGIQSVWVMGAWGGA